MERTIKFIQIIDILNFHKEKAQTFFSFFLFYQARFFRAFLSRLHHFWNQQCHFPLPCSNRQLPLKSVTSSLCSSFLNIKHAQGYIMERVPWKSDVSRFSKFLCRDTEICKKLYSIFKLVVTSEWHKFEMNERILHGRKGRLREVFFCIS